MFKKLTEIVMGSQNARILRRLEEIVRQINAREPAVRALSDAELRGKTEVFRRRLAEGETLDDLLPDAFAVVREAARRVLGQRHFDVQLIGGIVLHEGNIAEMKTGEGKTLVATLPAYLNALEGRGVHVVTVNDYLAKRDSEWMGQIYKFLGLTVGVVLHDMDAAARRQAYHCDITYGTNNEFGFDYLRDNMVLSPDQLVQRELHYAIVDEVDSILIDEARTPLIISGAADKPTELYYKFARIARELRPGEDYTVDEKTKTVAPTEQGVARVERMLGVKNLYDDQTNDLSHYLMNALRAQALMQRDRDYVVKDNQVIIVDEFTGRLMFGRRYSDGLHQAIEAKEGVRIERETQTLATITIQNYFRMYKKLAGMTGTAATEEEEFRKIYGMDVVVIPTNLPMIRVDYPDVVYRTEKAKFEAVVEEIADLYRRGQPVLVGTISIEKSERLSKMLQRRGIPHQVLNAKFHEKEAEIVAQAGRKGAVTIATNMAGRGTDIMLGGNPEFLAKQELRRQGVKPEVIQAASEHVPPDDPEVLAVREKYLALREKFAAETAKEHDEVVALGGLHIIGTERHEARRIDNQLRGRAGRQGDPGSSRFYVSLEDDLMRLFGSENIDSILDRLGVEEDMPIEHNLVSRAIENAQKKVEARNFDLRKHVLEYDDVMNQQREIIYAQRRQVLTEPDLGPVVQKMIAQTVDDLLDRFAPPKVYPEEWDLAGLVEYAGTLFAPPGKLRADELRGLGRDALRETLLAVAQEEYEARRQQIGPEVMPQIERFVMLRVVDQKWMDHLDAMDDLRDGIGLRAYGQRDPLVEYKIEAFNMFEDMIRAIREDTVRYLYHVSVAQRPREVRVAAATKAAAGQFAGGDKTPSGGRTVVAVAAGKGAPANAATAAGQAAGQPYIRPGKKIGRNDPCPCGSGKKYKNCHGKLA